MTQIIPAHPDIHVVFALDEKVVTMRPLIGWDLTGEIAQPVILGEAPGPVLDAAILFPNTDVWSVRTGESFNTLEEWLEEERELRGQPHSLPESVGTTPGKPDFFALDILRTDKGFKRQSFWRYGGPEVDPFLFEVDAGDYIPEDPRVEKITRDKFLGFKHSERVFTYTQIFDAAPTLAEREAVPEVEDAPSAFADLI